MKAVLVDAHGASGKDATLGAFSSSPRGRPRAIQVPGLGQQIPVEIRLHGIASANNEFAREQHHVLGTNLDLCQARSLVLLHTISFPRICANVFFAAVSSCGAAFYQSRRVPRKRPKRPLSSPRPNGNRPRTRTPRSPHVHHTCVSVRTLYNTDFQKSRGLVKILPPLQKIFYPEDTKARSCTNISFTFCALCRFCYFFVKSYSAPPSAPLPCLFTVEK